MNVTDVMIGDYVSVNNRPMHVTLAMLSIMEESNIQPIPITAELVAKNSDYVYHTQGAVYYTIDEKSKYVSVFKYDESDDCLYFDNIRLKYVHELQHLLKLLGTDKEFII